MIRPRLTPFTIVSCLFLKLIAVAGVARGAWPGDPGTNVPLCLNSASQEDPVSVSDGQGGAIVAWLDHRWGIAIYAQRVDRDGNILWAPDGVTVCDYGSSVSRSNLKIATDGLGGALLCWEDVWYTGDRNVFAQRLAPDGSVLWNNYGAYIVGAGANVDHPAICSDGAGGAYMVFTDYRYSTAPDVGCGRLGSNGARLWGTSYLGFTTDGYQDNADIAPDGSGNAVVVFEDWRGTTYKDITAQMIQPDGGLEDAVTLCAAPYHEKNPRIVASRYTAAGIVNRAIVTWWDERNCAGTGHNCEEIYAQCLGEKLHSPPFEPSYWAWEPMWTANGVPICTETGTQSLPQIVSDGANGAIIAWYDGRNATTDTDIYARKVGPVGNVSWAAGGLPVTTADRVQYPFHMSTDSAGGAILAWQDNRTTLNGIYAQRMDSDGAARWGYNGLPIQVRTGISNHPWVVPTGDTGAIVAWYDGRNLSYDIFCQGVDRYGRLGGYEPAIISVEDVPGDQGGKVHVLWTPSSLDNPSGSAISTYTVWRRIEAGASTTPGQETRVTTQGAESLYWEFVATVPARGLEGYGYMAPTTADTMPGNIPWNTFMVDCRTVSGLGYSPVYDSAPVSGFSVDNLSPAMPAHLEAEWSSTGVHLNWWANREADFAWYRLHRGAGKNFVPGPENLLSVQRDVGYVDNIRDVTIYTYKLCAVDVHGNVSLFQCINIAGPTSVLAALESAAYERGAVRLRWQAPVNSRMAATLYRHLPETGWQTVCSITGDGSGVLSYDDSTVEPGRRYGYRLGIMDGEMEVMAGEAWVDVPSLQLALQAASPNPATWATLRVGITLPVDQPASLELFDVQGRLVRQRDVGELGSGYHELPLSGESGRPAGIYLLRLTQGRDVQTRKVVVVN